MKKLTLLAAAIGALATIPTTAVAEDAFFEALSGGKVDFNMRYRYEFVDDQGNQKKNANANTLRTALGYRTGDFHGFGAYVQFEDVRHLGSDRFNDFANGETSYSVVADPEGTEVNQGYLSYTNFDTDFRLGRQEITYRKAPFHRFVGNVLWRQNHQSFDAFSIKNESFEKTKLSYAYIDKVHTIFGDDSISKPDEVKMDTHLFNAQYEGLSIGKISGYGYLLDFKDKPAASNQTFGARLAGGQGVSETVKLIYTAEFANQSDYKSGIMDDQNYYLGEFGGKYSGWLGKVSYEVLEGDGNFSFQTPLGTNHAFQGWADKFLVTPKDGIEDLYFTVVGKVAGIKLVGVYHNFSSDKGSYDYGDEIDLLAQKTFMEHYTLGVKYFDYSADSNSQNTGGSAFDVTKFWLYGIMKF